MAIGALRKYLGLTSQRVIAPANQEQNEEAIFISLPRTDGIKVSLRRNRVRL